MKAKQKSFTLIELLVVMAVIGLLAGIILVSTKGLREKARTANSLKFGSLVYNAVGAYLAGEWLFENNLEDTSGNNYHGSSSGGPGYVPAHPEVGGMALNFDGSTQYVETDTIPALKEQNITITAWIYWEGGTGSWDPIVTQSTCRFDWDGYYLYINNTISYEDNLAFWLDSPSPAAITEEKLVIRRWYFVAGTHHYDSGTSKGYLSVYLDGTLRNTIENDNTQTRDEPMRIGYDGCEDYFNGRIDEVRVYGKALTSSQIKKLYAEGAKKKGLLAEK